MRRSRENVLWGRKVLQEVAGTGFHGGRAGAEGRFEELLYISAQCRVVLGEIEERLKGERSDDGTAVTEITFEGYDGVVSFGRGELQAGSHLGEVPTEFDLSRFGKKAEQFGFVALQKLGAVGGDFFNRVGSAHADDGVFMPETDDEFVEAARILEDGASDLVGAADGAAVGTL
ncbi:MAG TPA: hypothetical protein VJN42_08980 [Candidatus Acidoferrum sp.]|nr:hypothetical protein [Candidatus Acidoferrum sp.]